jgi:hypothetical protein
LFCSTCQTAEGGGSNIGGIRILSQTTCQATITRTAKPSGSTTLRPKRPDTGTRF